MLHARLPALTAVVLALSMTAAAQTPMPIPKLSVAEGIQQFEAAGFGIGNGTALNMCNTPAKPQIQYLDLNEDGRAEALTVDKNAACYGEPGDWFTLVKKDDSGRWQAILRSVGVIDWEKTRTLGWTDARVSGGGHCDRIARFDGTNYILSQDCVAPAGGAGAVNELTGAERAAIFRAAGLTQKGEDWVGCEGDTTASIEKGAVRDLNGDGQPEAIVTESGIACYGNTGQGFHLLSKAPGGEWKLLYSSPGIPEFHNEHADGWPDIEIGGPGFCFPIQRWDGKTYVFLRNHEYRKGACAQR